jgi:hypothetical protein
MVEELAKELCDKFYFGWLNGYNDLSKSLGMPTVSGDAVKKKADGCIADFMEEASRENERQGVIES